MKKILVFITSALLALPSFAIETTAKQAIVIDDNTGTVLFDKNADVKMHPSSMSKLMTIYIVFKRLHEGRLKLSDTLPVSEKAWKLQGSKSFVEIGNNIAISDLLQGIIIQSGNDACMVIAEGLAGSEQAFAEQMNETAKELGLTNSHFVNSHGLNDENHLMSARDLATLAHHVIHDFPEFYHYFSQKEFVYHGIKQGNRNLLLYKNIGVDGLKTGHTDEAGYGIVVSGKDTSGRRQIIVINGLSSEKERAEEAEKLLAFALRDFEKITLLRKGEELDKADVWFGEKRQVGLTASQDLEVTLPKTRRGKLKFTIVYDSPLKAPIKQGDKVAELQIESPEFPQKTIPLVASEDVEALNGISKAWRALNYYLGSK